MLQLRALIACCADARRLPTTRGTVHFARLFRKDGEPLSDGWRAVEVAIPGLRGGHRAGSDPGQVHGRPTECAVSCSGERNCQARGGARVHGKVGCAEGLVRKWSERDRLTCLGDREGLRDRRCGVEASVPGLRRSRGARTGAADVHRCACGGATAGRGERNGEPRGRSRGEREVGVTEQSCSRAPRTRSSGWLSRLRLRRLRRLRPLPSLLRSLAGQR